MPKGIPKKGFRRSQKLSSVSLEEIERNLVKRSPDFLEKLEELTKPLTCPSCGHSVRGPDREAMIYLCNRALGMPRQKTEVDVTHNIALSADQIDGLLYERFNITIDDVREYIEYKKALQLGPPDGGKV